jgi:hypothetical protein
MWITRKYSSFLPNPACPDAGSTLPSTNLHSKIILDVDGYGVKASIRKISRKQKQDHF